MKSKKYSRFIIFFCGMVFVCVIALLSFQIYSKVKFERAIAIKEQAEILKQAIDQFIVKYSCEPWRYSEKGCDEYSIYGPRIYLTGYELWLVTDKFSLYKTGILRTKNFSSSVMEKIYFVDEFKNNRYTLCYKNLIQKACIAAFGDITPDCEEYKCLTNEYSY